MNKGKLYKSSINDLENRGFISTNVEYLYNENSFEELKILLKSKLATERTKSARFLSVFKNAETSELLCFALEIERKLYTKIEICNSLVLLGEIAIPSIISRLGKIGNNQYKDIPNKDFMKKSYPLPRDICARTLIRLGEIALPKLCETLTSEIEKIISEAIDCIGFISFYNKTEICKINLLDCYEKMKVNDLIKWKIIRAMCAFPSSVSFLNSELLKNNNNRIKVEIERSLKIIQKKN